MVIKTAEGWLLDVSHDNSNDDINLIIKLQDGKVISFKQTFNENTFYVLPKSQLEVLTVGYEKALLYITQSVDKLMNGEVQVTDLVISKLLRQNIEKYRSLFPHVAAAIRLNISGVITVRGDNIQYVHTDSNHTDPLQRITPARLISGKEYDKEKYLEMLLDAAESVLSVFGFSRSLFGFERKLKHWWDEIYQQRERDMESAKTELWDRIGIRNVWTTKT